MFRRDVVRCSNKAGEEIGVFGTKFFFVLFDGGFVVFFFEVVFLGEFCLGGVFSEGNSRVYT